MSFKRKRGFYDTEMPAFKRRKPALVRKTSVTKAQVQRMLIRKDEAKINDVEIGPTTLANTTTGGVGGQTYSASLSSIAEGTDYNNRVGWKIRMKSVNLDLDISPQYLTPTSTAVDQNHQGRWSIVLDRQANGGAASYSDVYSASCNNYGQHPLNVSNLERFKVIATGEWACVSGQSNARVKRYVDLTKALRPHDQVIQYNNTTAVNAITNNLLLYVASNGYDATGCTVDVAGVCRFRFGEL